MNRRTPERIKIDRAALVDFLRNMRNDDWESTWRKAADLVRVGWRESDIQALIKSGQIVSEIRREFDSANNYGDMSWRFGGAAVCVRNRRYVAVPEALQDREDYLRRIEAQNA